MIRYRNKNWVLTVTRNMSLFQSCLDVGGHYLYSKNYGLPRYEHLFVVKNGTIMFAHHSEKNAKKYHEKVVEISLNPAKFRKMQVAYQKYGNDLMQASGRLEKNPGAREYKNYIQANLNLSAGLYITTGIGKLIHSLLLGKLKLYFPDLGQNELELLVSEITYPKQHTPLTESRLDLLAFGAYLQKDRIKPVNIKKYPKATKIFEKYYSKYHFIPVNFNENPWTRQDIIGQLKALGKIDCVREKNSILRNHREKTENVRSKLEEIRSAEIKKMAEVLQTATILNEYRKYVFCRASLAYRPLFQKIAAENKLVNWRECWKLTPNEIFELRFNNDKKIIHLARGRKWAGIIYETSLPGYKVLREDEIRPFIEEINSIKEGGKKLIGGEIRGMVANKGKITGRAKIILGKSDFGKFENGDIIVTAMTSVDFIPLMERAGAFVTNEGGITSHASIVSRELNKPCIIGTKIATKVLRDGDLVEVDAEKGIIKVLKRK